MFEPITILSALAASGLTSAMVGAAGRGAARFGDGRAWSLAVGLGFYVGVAVLGVRPRWPMREDQDRFLGLVMPTILAAEPLFRTLRRPSLLGIAARLVAAATVAPAILYGSSYVEDLAGPGSAEWSPIRRCLMLGGLGLATACNWSGLVWMQARTRSAILLPLAQATALLGAGLAVMLSGYASGGLIAVALAFAVLGATAVAAAHGVDERFRSPGVGLVGLSGVLMMGAFFGRLRTIEAVTLFVAPLLAGVPEILLGARLSPRFHAVLGGALAACAAVAATATAWRRFVVDAGGF